ncbi:hypothetical protein VT50_0205450 [Streptomyces antioxidans]|uniref:Uncharacterized protein n=1 Tax=Streptomyces antioxidans TaxID=1507734 RepID=A0A1V4DAX2_9ACTN|nr:hypothetical protein [Streptomyces antioxidans]OPF83160.1 hypothetical protein VT50_0205450 [Streptomyces antioxidans]
MRTLLLTAVMTAIAAPALSLFLSTAAHDRAGTGTGGRGLPPLAVAMDATPVAADGAKSPGEDDTGWGLHGEAVPSGR